MIQDEALKNPRVIIIQKLYGHHLNKESTITFPKHRYKKFIKDVVNGTIERKDLIQDVITKELKNDMNENTSLSKSRNSPKNNTRKKREELSKLQIPELKNRQKVLKKQIKQKS